MVDFTTAVEWVELDPFNLAAYDHETDTVLIDKCFKGTPLEAPLLEHEFRHKHGRVYEEFIDMKGVETEIKAIQYKPLHLLQLIFPAVMCIRQNKKFFFKLDLFGLMVLGIVIIASTYMVTANYRICVNPDAMGEPNCTTMSWWDAKTGKGQAWINEQVRLNTPELVPSGPIIPLPLSPTT